MARTFQILNTTLEVDRIVDIDVPEKVEDNFDWLIHVRTRALDDWWIAQDVKASFGVTYRNPATDRLENLGFARVLPMPQDLLVRFAGLKATQLPWWQTHFGKEFPRLQADAYNLLKSDELALIKAVVLKCTVDDCILARHKWQFWKDYAPPTRRLWRGAAFTPRPTAY